MSNKASVDYPTGDEWVEPTTRFWKLFFRFSRLCPDRVRAVVIAQPGLSGSVEDYPIHLQYSIWAVE